MSILSHEPRWRSRSLGIKNIKDRYLTEYRKYRSKRTKSNAFFDDVEYIYGNSSMKFAMELMLICGEYEKEEIAEFFGVEEKIVEYYEKIFYDIEPIKNSRMKLMQVSQDCDNPQEKQAKLAAVRFGKNVVNSMLGLSIENREDFIQDAKMRIHDGLVVKSLGHEFVSSTDKEMDKFLKLMSSYGRMKVDKVEETEEVIDDFIGLVCDKFNEITGDDDE